MSSGLSSATVMKFAAFGPITTQLRRMETHASGCSPANAWKSASHAALSSA